MYVGKYTGPFNPMTGEMPENPVDFQSFYHDKAYMNLERKYGNKIYTHWSEADNMYLEALYHMKPGSLKNRLMRSAGITWFSLKSLFAPKMSLNKSGTDRTSAMSGKRVRAPGGSPRKSKKPKHKSAQKKRDKRARKNEYMAVAVDTARTFARPKKVKSMSKKHSKKPAFTKREKESIKRLAGNLTRFKKVKTIPSILYNNIECNYNKVGRFGINNQTIESVINDCDWSVRSPGTAVAVTNQIDPATYLGQRLRYGHEQVFEFCNNSNTSGEVVIYEFICQEYSSVAPLAEASHMRDAYYNNATTPLAVEDDRSFYWTSPNQKPTIWKIHRKETFDVKGGETFKYRKEMKPHTIDVNRFIEAGTPTFVPGYHYLEIRMMGRVTHSNKETTAPSAGVHPGLFEDQVTQFFVLDYYERRTINYWVETASDVVSEVTPIVASGITTMVLEEAAVSADPQIPEHALPAQV